MDQEGVESGLPLYYNHLILYDLIMGCLNFADLDFEFSDSSSGHFEGGGEADDRV